MKSNLTNDMAVLESIRQVKQNILVSLEQLTQQMPERKEELEIIRRHIR